MARRGRWKDDDGAVLVEFAIAIPILLLIVWGIVDFARAYYTVNSLATAVREGGRYAAVQVAPGTSPASDSIKSRVKQAFNPFGGPPILDAQIVIDDQTLTQGNVSVSVVNYYWIPTTPGMTLFVGDSIAMTRQSTFRWERAPVP
jgi:Flp pilus assembly protein TadG